LKDIEWLIWFAIDCRDCGMTVKGIDRIRVAACRFVDATMTIKKKNII
jgi:hypothetical protein